tara:strand:+ start:10565 stop:10993 length:429 start_codon:yes stop_codon:yes gene_type:complete
MIKYKLICKNCELSFDSWFASSNEFEKLKKKKYLNCHNCNSIKIEKTLMAPKLLNKTKKEKSGESQIKLDKINKKIKEYQKFVKNNFKYVGEKFAYEARSIHYNDKKNEKGIYGIASNDEMKELREEGIEAEILPWIEDKNN